MATAETPPPVSMATPNFTYTLSPEAQQLLRDIPLRDIMSFIYETGYSTCTEHCCSPHVETSPSRPGPSPSSSDDGFLDNIVELATNNGNSQPPSLMGPTIDTAQRPLNIPPSVKLGHWSIASQSEADPSGSTATGPHSITRSIAIFSWVKGQLDIWGGKVLNPAIYYGMLASNDGSVSPERNAFAQLCSRQLTDSTLTMTRKEVKKWKDTVTTRFENTILFSKPPAWFADNVFWSRPNSGYDELSKLYLAWRKIWHTFVFCPRSAEELTARIQNIEPSLRGVIPSLQLWGNVQNDYTLFHYQELSRKDLRYAYEHEPHCLRYMLEQLDMWRDEVELLNDYVGLRRVMAREHFHACKSAMQRAGSTMTAVVEADNKVARDPNNKDSLCDRERNVFRARLRFWEARACIYSSPLQI